MRVGGVRPHVQSISYNTNHKPYNTTIIIIVPMCDFYVLVCLHYLCDFTQVGDASIAGKQGWNIVVVGKACILQLRGDTTLCLGINGSFYV